jgi:hypothetical protein
MPFKEIVAGLIGPWSIINGQTLKIQAITIKIVDTVDTATILA